MKIKLEPVANLQPHPSNPRRDHDVDAIARSINAFGFRQPVVVWDGDGHLLAGHGRLLAAQQLGLEKIPVHRIGSDEITASQAAAYRIADNKSAEGSTWDDALLLAELEQLSERERLDAGFNAAEIADLQRRHELENLNIDPAEDDVSEPPAQPVSRRGDLWILGDHKLLCGDATAAEDVDRLLGDVRPDMAWCDPPYGVNAVKGGHIDGAKPFGARKGRVHGVARNAIIEPGQYFPMIGDDSPETATRMVELCAARNVPIQIFWGANCYASVLPMSRCWIAWDKETTGNFGAVELAWTNLDAPTKLFRHQWCGLMKASERGEQRVHPTQKPVALTAWCFAEFGKLGDVVLDLFLGSAPSLIAAEKMGRRLFGMELAPAYVDVAVNRWQAFTGKTAVLESGETFAEVAAARLQAAA